MPMNLQSEATSASQAHATAGVLFASSRDTPQLSRDEALPIGKIDGRLELPLEDLSFHRLTTPAQIDQILHLRGELTLPAAALADPSFHTREKKETSTGL